MEECNKLDSKLGDMARYSSSLNSLAGLYLANEEPEIAEKYIKKAIAIERSLHDDAALAVRLGMASDIYLKLGKPYISLKYILEAYRLDLTAKRAEKTAVRESQLGEVYIALKDLSKARYYCESALRVFDKLNSKHSASVCCEQLGRIAMQSGNKSLAKSFYQRCLSLCQATQNRYIERKAYYSLYKVERESDPVSALRNLEKYSQMSDSVFNAAELAQINQFNIKYETAEKEHELEDQAAKLKVRNLGLWISVGIILLVLLLIFVLADALRVKNKLNTHLNYIENSKNRFFTNITHEFRTPLTVILGMAEEMEMDPNMGREARQGMLKAINTQGKMLLSLVNQMLELAKSKASLTVPDWRRGNVISYCRMIVESYKVYAAKKGIDLEFVPELTDIEMDFVPDYLHKIIGNLISNSLKFTSPGGHIYLTVEKRDKSLLMRISDSGCGISVQDQKHIFDVFYQAGKHDAQVGTGIGLALAKQMTEAMGGTIKVVSASNKGTVFIVCLPLCSNTVEDKKPWTEDNMTARDEIVGQDVQNMDEKPLDDEEPDNMLTTILIVEDNVYVQKYIASVLEKKYRLLFASNGEEGLTKMLDNMPDLVISDVMMPVMDGFTMCNEVRKSDVINHIPIILVTARSEDIDRINGFESGADAYLSKPFNSKELLVRVRRLLDERRELRRKYMEAMKTSSEDEVKLSSADRAFVNKFVDLVSSKISQSKLTADVAAEKMCMSVSQLNRKLKEISGLSTYAYITHIRIAVAKRYLLSSDMSVGEIAMKCGFDDSAYFSRIFKQAEQLTPSQYRNVIQNKL